MITREQFTRTTLLAVIDHSDIHTIANVFTDPYKRTSVIRQANHFAHDLRPFVASLEFYDDQTVLSFQYRYNNLAPGDGGKVTYFENYLDRIPERKATVSAASAAEPIALTEQICFQSFLRILKLSLQSNIIIYGNY